MLSGLQTADATSQSAVVESTQVWFGPSERPVYGWVSMPRDGRVRGGAVLCSPMGEEGRAAHRTFRRLAEELAEVGIVALRFDYDGTGDSAGLQDDPDRVPAWLDSVEAARDLLLGMGAPDVAAVGMRLGATIAATLSASSRAFSDLVLWDPCVSGRTFLREGEALYAFSFSPEDEDDVGSGLPDPAYRHTPGFQYDLATATAMRGLNFKGLPVDHPLADRVLLLSRDDRPQPPEILARLREEGDRLTTGIALDQSDLLDLEPSDCFVPRRAVQEIVQWLAAGVARVEPVPAVRPAAEHPVLMAAAGPGSVRVRERSVRLGDFAIYGLLDEPVLPPQPAPGSGPQPWIVLVNVAAEHHIGPGRKWVELARMWAGLGYRCIRLDQSGVGDSETHPGQLEDMHFTPEWMDDMRQVVRELTADGSPVVMVGLCSGAYSALEVATADPVAGVFAINPRVTLYPAYKGSPLYTADRRAAIVPARPIARLAEQRRILAGGIWRIYRQLAIWHAPMKVLLRVVRTGTRVEVVACRDDGQHFTEVLAWRPVLWWLRRRGGLVLDIDEVFDHSMLTRRGQLRSMERATAFVSGFHGKRS